MADNKLKIIPLGGIEEVGKNMTLFECNNDIIAIDCGSLFPSEDLLGIDLVIPKVSYIVENSKKFRGFVFTHGHEDHIGAVPYILRQVKAPIYASKLTLALINIKLKEHRMSDVETHLVNPKDVIKLGCFTVTFVNVNHSIPGAFALIIDCPAGKVVFSGDFKIDYTPIRGETTDLATLAQAGNEGVMCLLCESTNIEHEGSTISESAIADTFSTIFEKAPGRIIIAMFASNVHRIQMAIDSAMKYGRKICFIGRSMANVTSVAKEINELELSDDWVVFEEHVDNYRDDQLLIITTGSQGEALAGLTRMAFGDHRSVRVKPTDTVVLSSSPIPGNEKSTARLLNQLYKSGANVVYNSLAKVHASGHACREELKIMHSLCKPKYFIPIHGEYRMLYQHAELAESLGISADNIILPELGKIIEMTDKSVKMDTDFDYGELLVDGLGIGDVNTQILRDRKQLSQDGVLVVSLAIDIDHGTLLADPEIIPRGFMHVGDNDIILDELRAYTRNIVLSYGNLDKRSQKDLRNRLINELGRLVYSRIKRKPVLIPNIIYV